MAKRVQVSVTLAAFADLPDQALVDAKCVALLFGCSQTTIWRRCKEGRLPAPVKVSEQQTRWRVGAIRAALESLGNGSEQAHAA